MFTVIKALKAVHFTGTEFGFTVFAAQNLKMVDAENNYLLQSQAVIKMQQQATVPLESEIKTTKTSGRKHGEYSISLKGTVCVLTAA